MVKLYRVGVAVIAGAILAFAFPPVGWGFLAIVAVALLTWIVKEQSAGWGFLLGFVAGFFFFAIHIFSVSVAGVDAWIFASLYSAAWIGFIGWGTSIVTRVPAWPVWVAGVWVLSETVRERVPLFEHSWGRLAFSQAGDVIAEWSFLGGMAGLTAIVAFAGAGSVAVLEGVKGRDISRIVAWGISVVFLIVFPIMWSPPVSGNNGVVSIGIVQGGTPSENLGTSEMQRVVLKNHVRETVMLGEAIDRGELPRPEFVLWPENASDLDPFTNPLAPPLIQEALDAVKVPILVGAVVNIPEEPDLIENVGIWWDPVEGAQEVYVKNQLFPFGEFIPFREEVTKVIKRLDKPSRDFRPGTEPGFFPIDDGKAPIGNVICFEIAYDSVIRELIAGGAGVLTVQTNNATFRGTGQPEQQFNISRLRAIETGRSVVVAATTGVSAAINPDGSVVEQISEGEAGYRVVSVPIRESIAPSFFLGRWVEIVFSIMVGVIVLVAVGAKGFARGKNLKGK